MMRRRPLAAVAAGVLAVTTTACNADDGPSVITPSARASSVDTTSSAEAPTSGGASATTPSRTSSAEAELTAGTCLGPEPTYIKVSCDKVHHYEVFHAEDDDTSAGDPEERSRWVTGTCYAEAGKFFGNEGFSFTLLQVDAVPRAVNPRPQERLACMATAIDTSGEGIAARTSSLKGVLKGNGFFDYNLCVAGKASATETEIVTCDQPHAAEAIGGKLNEKPGAPYPENPSTIHAQARKFCKPLAKKFLGGTRSDISYAENSGGEKPWRKGIMVTQCFVETKDGSTVTKSLKGIGDKPLSAYK